MKAPFDGLLKSIILHVQAPPPPPPTTLQKMVGRPPHFEHCSASPELQYCCSCRTIILQCLNQKRCPRIHFVAFRLSVHTNTLRVSFENASIWRRFWSESKRKRIHIVLLADGRKGSKADQNEISQACVCSLAQRLQLTSQRAILTFWNVLVETVESTSKR